MRLMLWHPAHAELSCKDCQKWIVDIEKAQFIERGGKRQRRQPRQPTPCYKCPKRGPEFESRMRLSKRNRETWQMFLRARAGGLTTAEREDPIVQRSLATLQRIYDEWSETQLSRAILPLLGVFKKP